MRIRAPKDFCSGLLFLAFAAAALFATRGYSLGNSGKMGPGYFPAMLGCVLAFVGVVLVARSFLIDGEATGRIHPMPLLAIAAAVVIFGAAVEPLGLALSVVSVTWVAAFAGRQSRPLETIVLGAALSAFSVGVFVFALRLPLRVWPALG